MKWFDHDIDARSDDKIFELIEAHGMMGYGLWWLILEELYASEETGFQIEATETWFKRIAKQANLTDWRSLVRVLDTMAEQNLIDAQLWAEHFIHCPSIMKRADAYIKKKALNAKHQATFREKNKHKKDLSAQDSKGLLNQDKPLLSLIDADVRRSEAHSDPDPDPEKKIKEIPQTPFEDFPRFSGESGSGGREVISFSEKAEERYSPLIQIEPPSRASERLEYPDTMVDPLMRQTMPSRGNFERVENPEFSSMRFEEFWQYSVPTGARRNKGEAKRQFMAISGIDYKTFKACYEKAVKAYQDKNPKEKPDEKFRFFKGLGRWIEDEEWIDFVPEHSRGGSVNLEMVLKGLPRIFRRETYVILPDGDWRINMAHCNALEHAEFSRGNYIPERHRQIWDMKDFLEKNPDCIQLADVGISDS